MIATSAVVAAATIVAMVGYGRRWCHLRRAQGPAAASAWRLAWFGCFAVSIAVALVVPFPAWAQQRLALHVVQHILIFDAAPILLIISMTPALIAPLAPLARRISRSWAGPALRPIPVLCLYVGMFWMWHVPPLYDLALRSPAVHLASHLLLLTVGTLFWWQELAPARYRRHRVGRLTSVFYLVTAKMLTGFVASALIFARQPISDVYRDALGAIAALEDQRRGGGILILVEGMIFIVAVTAVFVRLLGETGHDERDPAPS